MNIIINGFHEKPLFPLVEKTLKHFNVIYGHLTYVSSKPVVPSKMKAIFHNVSNLVKGDYGVDWEEMIPLDEDLIESMNSCEVVVLKMMDRHSLSNDPPLSYDERKRLYLKHLRYWNHVIQKNMINLFLCSSPPHEVYDFVIYCLCKLKKIPTIFFFQTSVSDTITMMEDWESNVTDIQVRYQELLKKYKNINESDIILKGRFKRDFELNIAKKDQVPFYMLRKKPSYGIVNNSIPLFVNLNFHRCLMLLRKPNLLVQSIINGTGYFIRIIRWNWIFRYYIRNTSIPDLSSKYVYFPLHMQPEATTSPLSGVYVNQILIVQMIAYYLPKDVYIYIKENPHQTLVGRDIIFYKELLKIPQVRFVPNSFNTYQLTNNSLAVVTATGTVGLEALYRCKPVLMFGHNFYQYAKGVFQIKNNIDCQLALKKILSSDFKLNIKDFKIFLRALEDTTIEGYIDINYKKNTYVTDTISNRNILLKIFNKIDLVCNL